MRRKARLRVLGIETTCDETSASVVEDGKNILSNIVATQFEFHREYAGVVPEIASRKHHEVINYVIELYESWDRLDEAEKWREKLSEMNAAKE